MGKSLSNRSIGWILFFLFFVELCQGAQSPLEVIRESNKRVLEIFRSNEVIDRERREEILGIIEGVTDLDGISGRAIGEFCLELSREQCENFDRIFRDLLRATYTNKLGTYRADRFEYLGQEIEGNSAVVRTIAFYQDDFLSLDYLMEKRGDQWKIINYVADDVDTVRNYRKQFRRLFARYTYEEVMERLKKKISELEEEGRHLESDPAWNQQ
jgi:phospholipid transport system substrate-binding protein